MVSKNVYISIACNQTPECADWGNNGLILFGANQTVAVLNPQYNGYAAKITNTYRFHTKRVTVVKWLRRLSTENENYFITGGDDGNALFWNINEIVEPFKLPTTGASITTMAGHYSPQNLWILAVASSDSLIHIFDFDGHSRLATQTIDLKNQMCFAFTFATFKNQNLTLMACSVDDASIKLWTRPSNPQEFEYIHSLIGHEGWVRGLDIVDEDNDLLLASCSQDHYVRLWRISPRTKEDFNRNKYDKKEENIVEASSEKWFAISVESVLYGHEGWVYGVQWHKSIEKGLRLLSVSMDKTIIIWCRTEDDFWLEEVRVGDVGGNSLGFYGGKLSPDGTSIIGHSYTGGLHFWTQDKDDECKWKPRETVGGHHGAVSDIGWDPNGEYLMSVSADQTTRIHVPWRRNEVNMDEKNITWHELARPQVHGYDIQALAILSRYKFASGADEKIVRAFQAPANFIENFRNIACIKNDTEGDELLKNMPKGASVPSLGLSNKAVYNTEIEPASDKHVKDVYPENYFVPVTMTKPPEEETLMQNTLWPEVHKLYGHGYEIQALAASPDGSILASACRSTTPEHSQIILWNTNTWKQYQKLVGHRLTITQMRFSPNGRYLLSVSRDRSWILYESLEEKAKDSLPTFTKIATVDKTNSIHQRMIWSCDWSHDSLLFATVSRDSQLIVWKYEGKDDNSSSLNGWSAVQVNVIGKDSLTAVAFAPTFSMENTYLLAVGSEDGTLFIYDCHYELRLRLSIEPRLGHHMSVRRLQFRPVRPTSDTKYEKIFHLASCSEDNSVRIHEIDIDETSNSV